METACTLWVIAAYVFGARGSNAEMDSGGMLLHARALYECLSAHGIAHSLGHGQSCPA